MALAHALCAPLTSSSEISATCAGGAAGAAGAAGQGLNGTDEWWR
eukprot:CAMPEP_0181478444 /NCGR_PEP_ID=MMETSP1110-20121109/42747_1 /TAXON_ID=174948 /ORGANISM="Symbiodinium sp., Strain CCMP421" /LENGTH=44 /DNA_ID= /DNA_START= /DNA_END= /DNA_ORIENTATION=